MITGCKLETILTAVVCCTTQPKPWAQRHQVLVKCSLLILRNIWCINDWCQCSVLLKPLVSSDWWECEISWRAESPAHIDISVGEYYVLEKKIEWLKVCLRPNKSTKKKSRWQFPPAFSLPRGRQKKLQYFVSVRRRWLLVMSQGLWIPKKL